LKSDDAIQIAPCPLFLLISFLTAFMKDRLLFDEAGPIRSFPPALDSSKHLNNLALQWQV